MVPGNQVSNVYRRCMMRNVMVTIGMSVMAVVLTGCAGSTVTTRSYAVGEYPRTTELIVESIVKDQNKQHLEKTGKSSEKETGYEDIRNERTIVVRTTEEGHRQIKEAIRESHLPASPAPGK